MDKVGLPRGLIRYDTTNHMEAAIKGGKEKFHFIRPRTIYYASVLSIVGAIMLYALIARAPLELHVLHDRNPLFVQLSDGNIRNGYEIKILNKTHDHRLYSLSVEGLENASIEVKAAGDNTANNLLVKADSVGKFHVYLSSDVDPALPRDVVFTLKDNKTGTKDTYDSVFISERE